MKLVCVKFKKMLRGGFSCSFLSLLGIMFLGACSDSKVPTVAVKLQASTNKLRADWRALLKWDDTCEQAYQTTNVTEEQGVETYAFDGDDQLVQVLCAVGSYEPSFLLYRIKQQRPQLLQLETFDASDEAYLQTTVQSELWGEISVDSKARSLVIVNVARQTKDCGTWADYRFTDQNVKLQTLYSKLPCPVDVADPVSPDLVSPPADWQRQNTH